MEGDLAIFIESVHILPSWFPSNLTLVALSIPSCRHSSIMSRLINRSATRKNKCRVSIMTWSMGIALKIGMFMQHKHLLTGFFERVSISLVVLAPWVVFVNDQDFVISQQSPAGYLHHTQLYVPFAALMAQTRARNFKLPPKKYSRVYSLPHT